MQNIPYTERTHDELLKALRKIQNALQMRDWEIQLFTTTDAKIVPPGLEDKKDNTAASIYDNTMLTATVYLNLFECQKENQDPLWNLWHEVYHIWLNYCDDEERQCNILAIISLGKEK